MNIKKIFLSNPFLFILPLLILITLLIIGFKFWFFALTILYILFYLIFIYKTLSFDFVKMSYKWIVLGMIVLLNISFVTILKPNTKTTEKPLTPAQCKPIYEQYNEKIVDITGEGLKGSVAIKINPENCEANVYYNFLTTMNLDKNYSIPNSGYSKYYYAASIREENATRDELVGTTQLSPVYTNKNTLPDPFTYGGTEELYNTREVVTGASTNIFINGWMSTFIFKEDSYDTIPSRTIYEAVDAAPFAIVEDLGNNSKNYSQDSDTACGKGNIVNTVQLTYTKR
jgi:energy-coupling factor transporter transmembrane protein EcfT